MKKFLIVALSVGGLGNRIYHSGEVVPEGSFDEKNVKDLIDGGFIVEYSEKTKKDLSDYERAKANLADLTAIASEKANTAEDLKQKYEAADAEYEAAQKALEGAAEEEKDSLKKVVDEKFEIVNDADLAAKKAESESVSAAKEVEKAQSELDKITLGAKAKKK